MNRKLFGNTKFLNALLVLQIIPILLYPPSIFNPTSQTWWLPMLLVIMALVGAVQIFRRSPQPWPLYLVAFAQGFNIISRLMMLMPQSTSGVGFDGLYFVLSVVAMAISTFLLWLFDQPLTRQVLAQ
ncbi:MAG: hypothetical protein CVU39_05130 [Chloroflexi bacterium HGW-Chloroflexi-10]|nr:MAG: hypothetical protein CVU39_05130 [Chloroflexi bacterium HGW-Chloroflexi-10]